MTASNSNFLYAADAKANIVESAELLKRVVDSLVEDLKTEEVTEIYMTLRLTPNEIAQLDISKNYAVTPDY